MHESCQKFTEPKLFEGGPLDKRKVSIAENINKPKGTSEVTALLNFQKPISSNMQKSIKLTMPENTRRKIPIRHENSFSHLETWSPLYFYQHKKSLVRCECNVTLLYRHVRKLKNWKGLRIAANDDGVNPEPVPRIEKDKTTQKYHSDLKNTDKKARKQSSADSTIEVLIMLRRKTE